MAKQVTVDVPGGWIRKRSKKYWQKRKT